MGLGGGVLIFMADTPPINCRMWHFSSALYSDAPGDDIIFLLEALICGGENVADDDVGWVGVNVDVVSRARRGRRERWCGGPWSPLECPNGWGWWWLASLAGKKGLGLWCCCAGVLVGEKEEADGRTCVDEKLVEENVENGCLSMADAVVVGGFGRGPTLPSWGGHREVVVFDSQNQLRRNQLLGPSYQS